jgi:hypothetical protein
MNYEELRRLAESIHGDSVPEWLHQELANRHDEISRALMLGQQVELTGPDGITVRILPKKSEAA